MLKEYLSRSLPDHHFEFHWSFFQLRGTVSTLEQVLELSHMEIAHFSTKKVEDSQREQARMRDIDKMLLAAKKKCEAEEVRYK